MRGIGIATSLAALWRDRRGNTLPIFAASLIPLLAIVGGGVDASRGYLTKTQLQNACDAGVLAGRRAMAKSGLFETSEKAKASRMFDANFDSAIVDAEEVTFDTRAGTDGDVYGTATATIPTVLMKLFGTNELSFSTGCMAELQITNTDVMFVLDTTGSMAGTRIQGLRDAVKDFHKTIASSVTDDDVRVRYGFVPYSMTVNARDLLVNGDMPKDYIANTARYNVRKAVFDSHEWAWTGSKWEQVYKLSGWRREPTEIDVSFLKDFTSVKIVSKVEGEGRNEDPAYIKGTPASPREYDMLRLATMSGTVGVKTLNYSWGGCIEERATVIDGDMDPVPSGATDLDINSAPNSDDTRWKPYFAPYVVGTRNSASAADNCPSPMQLYKKVDLTPNEIPEWLDNYVDGLVVRGNTYHDIGMIWGGRLASPSGIFADLVNDEPDRSVSRHIIFMTDGEMLPVLSGYSAYGIEQYDHRVAPSGSDTDDLIAYHNARFVAACNAIKDEGYTVWVIGFGSSLTTQMKNCATGHRAYYSNDSDELRATFRYIASQVADLRLGE